MKDTKSIKILCRAAALPVPLLLLLLASCCEDKFITNSFSADGHYEAQLIEMNCGATSPFTSVVSVNSTRPRMGLGWLGHSKDTVYAVDLSASHVALRWQGNGLIITCTKCRPEAVQQRLSRYRDIAITVHETE